LATHSGFYHAAADLECGEHRRCGFFGLQTPIEKKSEAARLAAFQNPRVARKNG
jgi:hypothetical protein